MIPVTPQPEPASFDTKVRKPGQKSLGKLAAKGIDLQQPLPAGHSLPAHWQHCLDDLYVAYGGVCAFLAVHFERVTGTASVDHFVAKSTLPADAYEWQNFRLACLAMNRKKNAFDDVLDPFTLLEPCFELELLSGAITPRRELRMADPDLFAKAEATIRRLGLDDPACRVKRQADFDFFIRNQISSAFLQRMSPFVYLEAARQQLL